MGSNSYIIVTGGAGYIGSHTVVELIHHGYNVIIIDNLCNSSYEAVARIEFLVRKSILFYDIDLRDEKQLSHVFSSHNIQGVIHFAALKAVGESTKIPLDYYDNNINGSITLLRVMGKHNVKTIVFSSSATVYGDATRFENMIPIPETCPNDPTNPYGKTKYTIENLIKDLHTSDRTWRGAILRYFNPIGAHPSGLIGEDPLDIPNNLLPYLAQVAIGRREKLYVFGNDYESHDGTPIRDYIHVVDLAKGHIAALDYMNNLKHDIGLYREWNLGTGKGSTVFDIYKAFCKTVGTELQYEVVGRRDGDVLNLTANPTRAKQELKWNAALNVEDACRDFWKWTTENPFGFRVDNYQWKLFNESDTPNYKNRLHTVKFPDLQVSFANYGALIQDVRYKDRGLVVGFQEFKPYTSDDNPLFGSTVGRYANRIANGSIQIEGTTYNLDKNQNGSTLHGGRNAFNRQYFLGPISKQYKDSNTLEFILLDKDGNNGFPADVETVVKYTVDNNSIEIEYQSSICEDSLKDATAISLTNHSYWNLSDGETIDGTILKLASDKYLKVDPKTLLPSGEITQSTQPLTKSIELVPDVSFDNCFIVGESDFALDTRSRELKAIAEASHPSTSIKISVASTEPAFQLYTGDNVDIDPFRARAGFCVEAGRYLSAINYLPWSKQVLLHKGEFYGSKLMFSFTC
ncbi:UDP-glucose 4-epimerase/aldose 1-epimerase [Schizosaccharomyces cryophilus OY26]|uniref:UDP-glucose 4-epimerase/aldose 1-epimerase n=1 Tax=Schizosaccharomyces cryophilus (strain OY26 / ATCC MYA-4695 / CBS 11777 / NBRC 106824 / NRRL Y48691) TaxID=653667 RepID=S9VZ03_SCHCR|nr:UDP-glucose 4-epimerase/aldose 1-epimerase [Schizosaccharomyces cryophilus OY26]EPY51055.1 UDP-glucose 4-epimerase/aldose 1-epimerase [Schizosaccharomyces cryophilus OY26]